MRPVTRLSDQVLTVAVAATPLLTLTVCYLVAATLEHVPSCVPPIDGCTSSSSTGRVFPERWIFIAGMLTTAILSAMFWFRCAVFIGCGDRLAWALRATGLGAALALAIYTVAIGLPGETPKLVRRSGAATFFIGTFTAQVMFIGAVARRKANAARPLVWLTIFSLLLPVASLVGELAKGSGLPRRVVNNVVEWNSILLVSAYFAVAGLSLLSRSAGRPASPRA